MTLALPVAAFLAGAWLALVVRALVARHAQGRIERAAHESLTPEAFATLRAYIAEIDEHERARMDADLTDSNARLLAENRGTRMRAKRLLRNG